MPTDAPTPNDDTLADAVHRQMAARIKDELYAARDFAWDDEYTAARIASYVRDLAVNVPDVLRILGGKN